MAFDDQKQEVVRSIEKGYRGDCIKVSTITDQSDNKFVGIDIRQFFTNEGGEHVPTRKGIRIPANLLGEFIEAIESLKDKVPPEEEGET